MYTISIYVKCLKFQRFNFLSNKKEALIRNRNVTFSSGIITTFNIIQTTQQGLYPAMNIIQITQLYFISFGINRAFFDYNTKIHYNVIRLLIIFVVSASLGFLTVDRAGIFLVNLPVIIITITKM